MNKRVITILIVVAVVALAIATFALTRNVATPAVDTAKTNDDTTAQSTANTTGDNATQSAPDVVTIVYTNSGFAKPSVTVKSGQTVRIQNDSDAAMSFNSDPHPTHTEQPELNVGEIAAGSSKTFVIDKVGTWGYHDHFNDSHGGKIVVE